MVTLVHHEFEYSAFLPGTQQARRFLLSFILLPLCCKVSTGTRHEDQHQSLLPVLPGLPGLAYMGTFWVPACQTMACDLTRTVFFLEERWMSKKKPRRSETPALQAKKFRRLTQSFDLPHFFLLEYINFLQEASVSFLFSS